MEHTAWNRQLSFDNTSRLFLDGASPACVTLQANFAAGDILVATGTVDLRISNLTFDAAAARSAGAVVHLAATFGATLENIGISGPQYGDAFLVDGANTTHIHHYNCGPPVPFVIGKFGAGACVHVTGPTSPAMQAVDTYISDGNSSSYHYGIELTNASGVAVTNVDNVVSGNGIIVDPPAGMSVWAARFVNVLGDTSYGDNWLFTGQGGTFGPISEIQVATSWASNSQTATGLGIVTGNLDGLQVSNFTALSNYGDGIALLAGRNQTFTNLHSCMNSLGGAGRFDGISIAAADHVQIVGYETGQCGLLSTTTQGTAHKNNQRYGVNLGGAVQGGQSVTLIGGMNWGNLARGNITAGVQAATPGSPNIYVNIGNN